MDPSTWAGTIGAVGSCLTAVALIITALAGYRRSKLVERKVDAVHVIVNQQHTDLTNYQRALIRALEDKGIAVPIDQSVANTESNNER